MSEYVLCEKCKACGFKKPSACCPSQHKAETYEEYMRCPDCGYAPLQFSGERTLTTKFKNAKAYCPVCPYEMDMP